MRSIPVSSVLKHLGVAIAFAFCGYGSSVYLLSQFPDQMEFYFPLPFALLCALLFLRTPRAVFVIPLMALDWLVASMVAFLVGASTNDPFLPGVAGGCIGACGLILCVAICDRRLLSPIYFVIGAIVGSLSAISFMPWAELYIASVRLPGHVGLVKTPLIAFAIWQAAVGTCLYSFGTHAKKSLKNCRA